MTIPEIKQLCREIIELAEKATPGPWEASSFDDYGHDYGAPVRVKAGEYDVARNGTPGCFLKEYDASFIAAARNVTPQMANALLEVITLIEFTASDAPSMAQHLVLSICEQLEADEDPYQSEDYQHYVAEVAKNCVASNGPCDACLAGGICDGDHLDPLCLMPDDNRYLLDYE